MTDDESAKQNVELRHQIVLVLQGGGALGAYQAGVYQALHEAGLEPDWVIGTSIGAINASLIAGNAREDRLDRLRAFWHRIEFASAANAVAALPGGGPFANLMTIASGLRGFFAPNREAMFGNSWPLGAEHASHYNTEPLRKTLDELVDFARINQGEVRIAVGAANIRTGQMHYFDSREREFTVDHVMASGALPPAFPAVRVDGELYWDGGLLSNTPLEAVFDDNPRRSVLIFSVHMWNPAGAEPNTIAKVLERQKEVQFASRSQNQIVRQRQIHKLRRIITQLADHIPEQERDNDEVRQLRSYGCVTQMHVMSLQAPRIRDEDHMKDIDFSADGIRKRWEAGYAHTTSMISRAPWEVPVDPLEGVILHELPTEL